MGRRGRAGAREDEMRAVLARWERSGLPLSRFADREGVGRKTLYRWRQRLGTGGDRVRRGRPPVGEHHRSPPASIFTELSTAVGTASSSAMKFEVVLGSGMTVRVPEHFDAGALRLLLETLRAC